jgi:small redox-active disulfide protein 2
MTQEDVVQIRVDGYTVGIMGLKTALEELATTHGEKTDSEVTETLINRLSKKNYIPAKAHAAYGQAFLREFKKSTGKPYEEEVIAGLDIKVLGPGCSQCDGLEQELMAAVSQTGVTANIEHVRDSMEIGKWGVMGTPALVINGRVKSVGKVPPRSRLIQWIEEADAEPA